MWNKILLLALLLGAPTVWAAELGDAYVNLFKMQVALAETGGPREQYNLGKMYEQGLGTERDLARAFELYSKAARQGEPRARRKLAHWKEVEKQVSADFGENLVFSKPGNTPEAPAKETADQTPKKAEPIKSAAADKKAEDAEQARKRKAWEAAMAAALKRTEEEVFW